MSSVVNRPTRPTEPLGRSVGLTSDSWSCLAVGPGLFDYHSRNYQLKFWGEMGSRNEYMHIFEK